MTLSRKDFLRGAAAGTAGIAMAGLLNPLGAQVKAAETNYKYGAEDSGMKITKVTPYLCSARWLMVKVETDAGLVGWGECGAWARQEATADIINILSEKVTGWDPFKINWIWDALTRTPHFRGADYMAAVSAIDVALWDLKGKAFGVPIYELLGGKVRDKIRAYETAAGKTPEEEADNVKRLVEDEGWKHIRIRPIHGTDDQRRCYDNTAEKIYRNIQCLEKIRDAVGYGIDISVEWHRGLKPAEAIEYGKRADPYMIHFCEDPVCDIPEIIKYVSEHIVIPMATGERCINHYEEAYLINETNVRFVRPDMCVLGGITAGKKVADIAEAKGVYVIPHNPLGPISTAAALQLDAVMPNFECQEWPGTFGNMSEIMTEPFEVEAGYIKLPQGPGLGVELVENFWEVAPYVGNHGSISLHEDGSIVDR